MHIELQKRRNKRSFKIKGMDASRAEILSRKITNAVFLSSLPKLSEQSVHHQLPSQAHFLS